MKNISEFIQRGPKNAISVNGGIAINENTQYENQSARALFNELSKQLHATFPAMKSNFKDQRELDEFRRQWVMAFSENGITTIDQINLGMKVARRQGTPFLPSPGQFITWCKQAQMQSTGLPSVEEVLEEFHRYCRLRDDYSSAERFPWKVPVMYWIVTDMRKVMLQYNLGIPELRKKAEKLLIKWGGKVLNGESIPAPVIQLADSRPPTTKGAEKGWETNSSKMLGMAALAAIRAKNQKKTNQGLTNDQI